MIATIVRLKVTLNDVEPSSSSDRGSRRHQARSAASDPADRIGLDEQPRYEIRAKDVGFGIPDPAWPGGPLDARKATLVDILENRGTKTLRHLYDFGDGWDIRSRSNA